MLAEFEQDYIERSTIVKRSLMVTSRKTSMEQTILIKIDSTETA